VANPGNAAMSLRVEGEKTDTGHPDKTVEREGGTGEGRQPLRSPHSQKNANTTAMKLFGPRARGILAHVHIKQTTHHVGKTSMCS